MSSSDLKANIWTTNSVYYNSLNHHELLVSALRPLIQKLSNDEMIDKFHLWLRGDQVIVSFKALNVNEFDSSIAKDHLDSFIRANPSPVIEFEYPLKSFFMNGINNSVIVLRSLNHSKDLDQDVKFEISRAILETASLEPIDVDSNYTLLVYLQFGFIKAVCSNIEDARDLIGKLIEYSIVNFHKKDRPAGPRDGLLLNSEVLDEIMYDIWVNFEALPDLEWMNQWVASCWQYIRGKRPVEKVFFYVSSLIADHLNLNQVAAHISLHSLSSPQNTNIN